MNYLRELCDKLFVNGIGRISDEPASYRLVRYTPDSLLLKQLSNLPEKNLKWLVDSDISECSTIREVIDTWQSNGLLNFEPVVMHDKDNNPVWMLEYDKYLHLGEGKFFYLSNTLDQEGVSQISSFSIRHWLNLTWDIFAAESDLYYLLMYSALIDCGCNSTVFDRMLRDNDVRIHWFLNEVMEARNIPMCSKQYISETYIDVKRYSIHFNGARTYVLKQNGDPVCYLYFCPDRIACEYKPKDYEVKTVILNIPEMLEGLTKESKESLADIGLYDRFERELKGLYSGYNYYEVMLASMLLRFAGISLDWVSCQSNLSLDKLPMHNIRNVKTVQTLEDLVIKEEV